VHLFFCVALLVVSLGYGCIIQPNYGAVENLHFFKIASPGMWQHILGSCQCGSTFGHSVDTLLLNCTASQQRVMLTASSEST